jgi:hypothetical protein
MFQRPAASPATSGSDAPTSSESESAEGWIAQALAHSIKANARLKATVAFGADNSLIDVLHLGMQACNPRL